MAQTDRFMIAPPDGGMQTDLRPWLIPDNAFAQMSNAYVFRGRVRKRIGARLMLAGTPAVSGYETLVSRLRVGLGTAQSGTIPSGYTPAIGQMFSIGTQLFTVTSLGTPANMLNTGATTGTFNTSTGAYSFSTPPASTVYFYPALPVMGILTYQTPALKYEPTLVFDQVSSYQFTANGWDRFGSTDWTGSDSNFFTYSNSFGNNASKQYLFVTR